MAQGHLLPMVDIGRLLAQRDTVVTIVTTPQNAGRVRKSIDRVIDSGCPIRLVQLQFPGAEVGLSDVVQNIDMVYATEDFNKFFTAANKMEEAVEKLFEKLTPRPKADRASYGVVINSFEELESAYVDEYRKVKKAWCIGPVSLSHKDESDKAERGNKASINEKQCLRWLDSQEPNCHLRMPGKYQLRKVPGADRVGFGLRGIEQAVHLAIGGFLTHCGWNSTIEGISAGVPLITFPLFADQFCNEKLVVQILKTGVSLGVDKPTMFGDEKSGFLLKKEQVQNAIQQLMDEGDEGIERRKRAKEFGEKAERAVEVGGSSYLNMTLLIQDIIQRSRKMYSDLISHEN
ncbi:UDP-Glycosyltransferase superfamily protein [Hibiscus syriacus]|uniref:UDP-Glycosyltransferase superfamily protein n=1 Tax=Hibiscus syriacus TaxID=106335 RepID=A0A6A2WM95_HIBSY|nr:UDP-Glycosyltransferase superfamily protein [Hibiscus syriacus]